MADRNLLGKLILRNDTSTNWVNSNIILSKGEVGLETDTMRLKVGDGTSEWGTLPYYYDNETIEIKKFNGVFTTDGWSSTTPYTQTIAVDGLKNIMDSLVVVDVLLSGTQEQQNIQEQAYGKILRYDTGENTLTATCRDDKPTSDFTIQGYYGIYIGGNGIGGGGSGDGVKEAPIDGKLYGRKDAVWTEVISGGEGNVASVDGVEPDAQGNVVLNAAKQTDLLTHTSDDTVHITSTERTNWNGAVTKANAAATQTDLTTHTGNADVHVVAADKTKWNTASTQAASAATQTALTAHTDDTVIHVTSADKTDWNGAVTKANAAATLTALTAHTDSTDIHVTTTDKTNWNNTATIAGAAIPKTDIVNTLNDTSAVKPLSAAQGKILNDTKITDAPSDGKIYNRRNASWIEASTGGISEAPTDGQLYGRKTGSWDIIPDSIPKPDTTELTEGNLAIWSADGELFDAGQSPIDLKNAATTQAINVFNTQRPDAPVDGQLYGRKGGNWTVISSTFVFSSTQPSNPTEGMVWLKPV